MSLQQLCHDSRYPAVAKAPHVSVETLCGMLAYDPNSGAIIWRTSSATVRAGDLAGTIDRKGYRVIKVLGRTYKASRIAWALMYGRWPPQHLCVDHIDRNKANNAALNLRLATQSENRRNNGGNTNTKSALKGAYARRDKWRSAIWIDGKLKQLGTFGTAIEAHLAYCRAAAAHYGEFAAGRRTVVPSTSGRAEREWEAV